MLLDTIFSAGEHCVCSCFDNYSREALMFIWTEKFILHALSLEGACSYWTSIWFHAIPLMLVAKKTECTLLFLNFSSFHFWSLSTFFQLNLRLLALESSRIPSRFFPIKKIIGGGECVGAYIVAQKMKWFCGRQCLGGLFSIFIVINSTILVLVDHSVLIHAREL